MASFERHLSREIRIFVSRGIDIAFLGFVSRYSKRDVPTFKLLFLYEN